MIGSSSATTYPTPWGPAWIRYDESGPIEMGLPGTALPDDGQRATLPPAVAALAGSLEAYWRGGPLPEVASEILERAATTPFMLRIYEVVSSIPQGESMTYADVARAAGRPGAARSVGAAMARNPFAPLIPCHRVVGSDGTLRGYGGGLEMKQALLDMERRS